MRQRTSPDLDSPDRMAAGRPLVEHTGVLTLSGFGHSDPAWSGSNQATSRSSAFASAARSERRAAEGPYGLPSAVSARFRIPFDGESSPRTEDFETILAAEIWAATEHPGVKHRIWVESGSEG